MLCSIYSRSSSLSFGITVIQGFDKSKFAQQASLKTTPKPAKRASLTANECHSAERARMLAI